MECVCIDGLANERSEWECIAAKDFHTTGMIK